MLRLPSYAKFLLVITLFTSSYSWFFKALVLVVRRLPVLYNCHILSGFIKLQAIDLSHKVHILSSFGYSV